MEQQWRRTALIGAGVEWLLQSSFALAQTSTSGQENGAQREHTRSANGVQTERKRSADGVHTFQAPSASGAQLQGRAQGSDREHTGSATGVRIGRLCFTSAAQAAHKWGDSYKIHWSLNSYNIHWSLNALQHTLEFKYLPTYTGV